MTETKGVDKPADYWRLAFIFDAPESDVEALAKQLVASGEAIRAAANDYPVRMGVAEHFFTDGVDASQDYAVWRTNDGAVEVTVPASKSGELPSIAAGMCPVLAPLAKTGSMEVMAGPVYFMVQPRPGRTFLSLSFKRDPATTKEEFSRWWFYQHSKVAIPILGAPLLAYDQVHCDDDMTDAVSTAFGVAAVHYDAYDNLTFPDWQGFLDATSDPAGGQQIAEDEIGRIDNSTRRHAMMVTLN